MNRSWAINRHQFFMILISLVILTLIPAILSGCTNNSQVVSVTQIVPVTQVISITQIVPVTEVVRVTQTVPTPQITPISIMYTVFADQDWQSTGILVPVDYQVKVTYVSGAWTANFWGADNYTGAEGYEGLFPSSVEGQCGLAPLPDAESGALVAKMGDDPAFLVGSSYTFIVHQSEPLYFKMNDACISDNRGKIIVEIAITLK